MARAKRSFFTVLGWVVWKFLSLFGLKFAKDKLRGNESGTAPSRR